MHQHGADGGLRLILEEGLALVPLRVIIMLRQQVGIARETLAGRIKDIERIDRVLGRAQGASACMPQGLRQKIS